MNISKNEQDYFRTALLDQKSALLKEAEKTVESELGVVEEEMADSIDRSAVETERNFTLRLRDRERKLMKKIEEALERLDGDEFGNCQSCGESIGVKRLKARPVATLCIQCKEDQEEKENQRG